MTTLAPLKRFRTIGLDDLVARAEMLTRIDRKYLLTQAEAGEFLGAAEDTEDGPLRQRDAVDAG